MKISTEEWDRAAALAAASDHGRRHRSWYVAQRYAPHAMGLILLGALGFGGWWLWDHVGRLVSGVHVSGRGGLPVWFFAAVIALAVVSLIAFRPGRIDRLGVLAGKFVLIGAAWIFVGVYLIGFTIG